MKARNFRYVKPRSLDEALRILADAGPEAVPMSGGQSLMASLNMRLSAPALIVDIGDLTELQGISQFKGGLRLGATTRHRELLTDPLIAQHAPLLPMAAQHIAHVAIRNRGTLGGSLGYADPAAELPACMVALGATLILARHGQERRISAEDFFKGLLETALMPGELIVAVEVPTTSPDMTTGFEEITRRHGDFAMAGLAALVRVEHGILRAARLVYFGCVDHAKLAKTVTGLLCGKTLPLGLDENLAQALAADLDPLDAPGLRRETRLHLAGVLTKRVLNSCAGAQ